MCEDINQCEAMHKQLEISFVMLFCSRNKEGNDMSQQQTSWTKSLANKPPRPLQTICARLSAKTPASLDLHISTEIEESAWSREKS